MTDLSRIRVGFGRRQMGTVTRAARMGVTRNWDNLAAGGESNGTIGVCIRSGAHRAGICLERKLASQ